MACAARLAARGVPVTVAERSSTVGGAARIVRNGRFAFDFGPTSLTLPAVYRDLFLQTGAPLEDCVTLVELDDAYRVEFAGGPVLRLPGGGVGRWAQAINDALGADAGQQWRDFTAVGATVWAAARSGFLEVPAVGHLTTWRSLRRMRAVHPRRSLRSVTTATLRDPRLRQFAEHSALFLGADPRSAPAALACVPYLTQTFGTHHIQGGIGGLAQALHERCMALGVIFEFDTEVLRVVGSETVAGVELSEGYVPCDAVVWAADPGSGTDRGAAQFTVLQALAGTTHGLTHHNYWLTDSPDDELDAIAAGQPFDSPSMHVCEPDDDAMRPPDSCARRISVPAARHDVVAGANWRSLSTEYATHVTRQLADRGHSAAVRTIWEQTVSPADYADALGNGDGAVSGPAYRGLSSALARRDRGGLRGEYRIGSSAHPGPSVPLVGMGARTVASMVAAQIASTL